MIGRLAGATRTVAEAIRDGADRLSAAGIDNPRLESRLLLAHASGVSSEALLRDPSARSEPGDFERLVARRAGREPLAYILGWREFWSLRFECSPATLIPRPDSETLVEAALAVSAHGDGPRVLDLGTGTGCLLLAFLHERPNAFGIGVDRSEDAARLARTNAQRLGLARRSAFFCGDWAASLGPRGRFDLVIGNPPYVASPAIAELMPDVSCFEPIGALDGGPEGLTAYRVIIATLTRILTPAGLAVLEIGEGQFDAVAAIGAVAGFKSEAKRDLSGIERAIILRPAPEITHWHHHVTAIV